MQAEDAKDAVQDTFSGADDKADEAGSKAKGKRGRSLRCRLVGFFKFF